MTAPITYTPDAIPFANTALGLLSEELAWQRRESTPRCEYYCNDFPKPYVYGRGKGRREYLPQPYHPFILHIREIAEAAAKCRFEVCFLNKYLDQSDQLNWHADDSPEMDDSRPIAIVSLGVEREIWFRQKLPPGVRGQTENHVTLDYGPNLEMVPSIEKLKLGHGSLCLMGAGMQDTWQHRIPKASFKSGVRVSLTFRGYVAP
jgi:alkylated DNA repair dioxygenase AlkB